MFISCSSVLFTGASFSSCGPPSTAPQPTSAADYHREVCHISPQSTDHQRRLPPAAANPPTNSSQPALTVNLLQRHQENHHRSHFTNGNATGLHLPPVRVSSPSTTTTNQRIYSALSVQQRQHSHPLAPPGPIVEATMKPIAVKGVKKADDQRRRQTA